MKSLIRKIAAGVLAATILTSSAFAITTDGQDETWFDGVWSLINGYGLEAENNSHILQNYINKYLNRHPEEMYDVINDILSLLDSHSMYLSSEEYASGFPTLEGSVGVGLGVEQTAAGAMVAEVSLGSAAEEAGILVGDVLQTIDGVDVSGAAGKNAAGLLRGAEGTKVSVTANRNGQVISASITRRAQRKTYVSSKTVSEGIEYIAVEAMGSENDWTEFEKIWNGLKAKNTKSVILDLRGNGGGLIDVSRKMIQAMTEKKGTYLFATQWRSDMGGLIKEYAEGSDISLNKIVVLVDEGTASAAELLAGSLQDTGSAELVGQKTYGKGQGQYHIALSNGDKLVITTLELMLPKTGAYEGVGLMPDYMVKNGMVMVDKNMLSDLDMSKPIYYGTKSDDVLAMTERLAMLGLLAEETDTFDSTVLDAVHEFYKAYEIKSMHYASSEMLKALDKTVKILDGETIQQDAQYEKALELAKAAAEKPVKNK